MINATGAVGEVARAYVQATDRFDTVLTELVEELPTLRSAVGDVAPLPQGSLARRMMAAVAPHRDVFVTPMAAVAGAVADEVRDALVDGRNLATAHVNNSGDIAFHLAPGQSMRLGVVGELDRPGIDGVAELTHDSPVRGIATSGWRGRSWSFGIADAVTVLAQSAAAADVAATLIANAVNADHTAIERKPACEVDDNTDLGTRPVTVDVGDIDIEAIATALDAGDRRAADMYEAGHILAAVILLKGEARHVGAPGRLLQSA